VRHLLRAFAGPDVQRLRGTLCLLQRRALGQLGRENERSEHVAQFLDAELVLKRLNASTVDDDAEGLQARGQAAANFLDGAQRTVGCSDGEQAGLCDDGHAVGRCPGGAGQSVERWRAVDENEVVVLFDVGESFFELPDVANAGVRPVEVDRRR